MAVSKIESQTSLAVRTLARLLLEREEDALPSTKALAEKARVGIATVIKALDFLCESGAVQVVRVQRSGTTIERLDRGRLWASAGYGPVHGVLPASLSQAMQGLEAAVRRRLAACAVEVSLTYRAGALLRLKALEAGEVDFTIVSQQVVRQIGHIVTVHEFPAGSYYGTTGIYRLLSRERAEVRRVGADRASPDHLALVEAEFPGGEILHIPFRDIPGMIARDELDASAWYGGSAVSGEYINHLRTEPATSQEAVALCQTPAVLVTSRQSPARNLLLHLDKALLDRVYHAP